MKKLILSTLLSLQLHSEPWSNFDKIDFNNFNIKLILECDINLKELNQSASPSSLSSLYEEIEIYGAKNLSSICKSTLNDFKKYLDSHFYLKSTKIGIQTKTDNLYIQSRGDRYFNEDVIFFEQSGVLKNFAYSININKINNEIVYDGSYISYLFKPNFVIKAGRYNRWWSPSSETSLILSNSARPFPSLSISNYRNINSNNKIFKFFGPINYELFLGQLDKNREIPNALIFGNRLSFQPLEILDISLLRVALFGGKDRSVNTETIKNLILGKDTINSRLSFDEQPGNQIAGIDFSLKPFKGYEYSIYAQILGEDGLDPISNSFIKFPSKRFGMLGVDLQKIKRFNYWDITIEHVNTDSGFKNVTYNHSLYKTGYRYKGYPIGARIDADSHSNSLILKKDWNNQNIKIKFQKLNINQNQNNLPRYGNKNLLVHELSIKFSKKLKYNRYVEFHIAHRDTNNHEIKKHKGFLKFEQRL